jgi:hypothetical protein
LVFTLMVKSSLTMTKSPSSIRHDVWCFVATPIKEMIKTAGGFGGSEIVCGKKEIRQVLHV